MSGAPQTKQKYSTRVSTVHKESGPSNVLLHAHWLFMMFSVRNIWHRFRILVLVFFNAIRVRSFTYLCKILRSLLSHPTAAWARDQRKDECDNLSDKQLHLLYGSVTLSSVFAAYAVRRKQKKNKWGGIRGCKAKGIHGMRTVYFGARYLAKLAKRCLLGPLHQSSLVWRH